MVDLCICEVSLSKCCSFISLIVAIVDKGQFETGVHVAIAPSCFGIASAVKHMTQVVRCEKNGSPWTSLALRVLWCHCKGDELTIRVCKCCEEPIYKPFPPKVVRRVPSAIYTHEKFLNLQLRIVLT